MSTATDPSSASAPPSPEQALRQLHETLRALLAQGGERGEMLAAFSARAQELGLAEGVPEDQAAWVNRRINCMLSDAGLVPAEAEGEPCPTGLDGPSGDQAD